MLQVDPRAGSGDLLEPLKKMGLAVQSATLEFGDFAWVGGGPEGRPVTVGVELKTVEDVLACIANGRFAGHQLPGLQHTYEVYYLMVEGRWTVAQEGKLLTLRHGRFQPVEWGSRAWTYASLDNWLTTMEVCAGVRVRRSPDRHETLQQIYDLYSWWTSHAWEGHRSHMVTYLGGSLAERVYTNQASTLARGLMCMVRGLGEVRARAVAARYEHMKVLIQIPAETLEREVEGIGPKLAKAIVAALCKVE